MPGTVVILQMVKTLTKILYDQNFAFVRICRNSANGQNFDENFATDIPVVLQMIQNFTH